MGGEISAKHDDRLKAIFADTLKECAERPVPDSHLIPAGTHLPLSPEALGGKKAGKITVVNEDCLVTAQQFSKAGHRKILMMNNANAHSAGGGVKQGTRAQEEDICRRSTAYNSLISIKKGKYKTQVGKDGRDYYQRGTVERAMMDSGAIVSTGVTVLKDGNYELLPASEQFKFDLYSVAAHKLNEKESEKDGLRPRGGNINYDIYAKKMEAKIRNYIYYAINNGYTVLVPGAIGCGAFRSFEEDTGTVEKGHTARIIAGIYKKLLIDEGLANYFDEVCFAILENKPSPNTSLSIFQEKLKLGEVKIGYWGKKPSASSQVARGITTQNPSLATASNKASHQSSNKVAAWFQNAWESVKQFFTSLWDGIKGLFNHSKNQPAGASTASNTGNTSNGPAKTAVNTHSRATQDTRARANLDTNEGHKPKGRRQSR